MTNRWMVVLCACSFVACGGSSAGGGGSGTATGTVGNLSFSSVAEAVSIAISGPICVNGSPSGTQSTELVIVLSDSAGHCGTAESSGSPVAGTDLVIIVDAAGSTTPAPIGAGTYNVTTGGNGAPAGGAFLFKVDANGCTNHTTSITTSGSITLSSVTSSGVTGTYNLSFVDTTTGAADGTLSGSFTSTACGAPVNNTTCPASSGGSSC